jgi:hypothetical protein
VHEEADTRERLLPLLLGTKPHPLVAALTNVQWRGGYITKCKYTEPRANSAAITTALFAAPAMSLARELELDLASLARLSAIDFAAVPCRHALRSLWIDPMEAAKPTNVDRSLFAAMPSLTSLAMMPSFCKLAGTAKLDSVRELSLSIGSPDILRSWFTIPFSAVTTLALHFDVGPRERAQVIDVLALLFDGTLLPAVTSLMFRALTRDAEPAILAALRQSPLLGQLREVVIGSGAKPPLPAKRPGFEHVALRLRAVS